jgi:hypothetical protein
VQSLQHFPAWHMFLWRYPSFYFFLYHPVHYAAFWKYLKITFRELTQQQIQFVYIVWLYYSFFIYSGPNFGQREQLIFQCIAPFLILRHARYLQARIPLYLSIPIALAAFCGVAIKPFYILPILAIEILQALVNRRSFKPLISPETGVFVLAGILYLTHFYFFQVWLLFMTTGWVL